MSQNKIITKTIFVSVFEGVEAKNILRTDILPTLLADPAAKIILLMKNQERVDYYKKEFGDPRIIYEIVPYSRALGKGLDRIFASLKFTLLRTQTTNLQRRLAYETAGNYTAYYCGHTINFLLARPMVRKVARFLDFLMVKNDIYAPVFDKYKPDIVFLAHLFEEPEIHVLREAKRRKIKTIGFMNSWDKPTAKCIMRLLPDKAVVFNDIVKRELVENDEMKADDIFAGGIPQYDGYFRGVMPVNYPKKTILFAPMGIEFSDSDWDFIDLLRRLNREGKFGENTEVLIRFQPSDFIKEDELKKRPDLLYELPGVRFMAKRGVDWDMGFKDLELLLETLRRASLVICYASSLSIDAAVFDKPVINVNFELRQNQSTQKTPTRRYGTAHYSNVLRTGGVRLVGSERELILWVVKYLNDPALDMDGRRRLVEEQCKFTDGRSGERIGKFMLNQL